MNCRVLVTMLSLIISAQLLAEWSETGRWVSNDDNDGLNSLLFVPDGTLFVALEEGDYVFAVIAEWDYKPENCWTDKIEKADRNSLDVQTIEAGNLLISTADADCCLNAERVGKNLILSKVWIEADDPLVSKFCADFVLSRE